MVSLNVSYTGAILYIYKGINLIYQAYNNYL